MPRPLRDVPIRRKLMLLILLASSFALVLMGSALIIYELVTFRRAIATNVGVLAQIVGSNSAGALAFENAADAQETLRALAAERQITAAAIYDSHGELFARFPWNAPVENFPQKPPRDDQKFARGQFVVFRPIVQDEKWLGTIYLQADLDEMYERFRVYGALLVLVGAASVLGALAFSARFQRLISVPVLELARLAGAVSERQDYSVRAQKHGADELGDLTDAFNQMLTRIGETNAALAASEQRLRVALETAERANQAKDDFLAILSHEMRTPLTPVLATIGMVREDGLPPHLLRDLDVIERNVAVEARLIDDLLDVTRIVRGKLELHRNVVDLRPLLDYAMKTYCGPQAAAKNLRVDMNITAEETHAFADSSRITQVFWNLLQNACKFTPEGGTIRIRAFNENRPQGRALVVEIHDTGIGIDAAVLPRIFDAFEQGDRSRTRQFGGLGLGLAICRAIVESHGGSLIAVSEGRDKGATFTACLQTVPAPEHTPAALPHPEPGQMDPPRSLRILLVEDHADSSAQLARLLTRSGHQVTCAFSLEEARRVIAAAARNERVDFDLIISDLGLPDGSGHELMREVAARFSIPAIALSGYGTEADVQKSLASGFTRHITKPVDWPNLKSAIESVTADATPLAKR